VTRVLFLTLDEVLALHADQIRRYGGRRGIRDVELLKSALGTPQATFDGALLHSTSSEMAAAYLFHLVQNHAFIDGNKRVGLVAALAFLGLNDVSIEADPDELTELVLGVAAGKVSKAEVAVFLQNRARRRR
jgi:death-on-curing protein